MIKRSVDTNRETRHWIKNELNLLTPRSDQADEVALKEALRQKTLELEAAEEAARKLEEERLAEEERLREEEERNRKYYAEVSIGGDGDRDYAELPDNEISSVVMEEEI